jgi:glucose-6-phosphate isomerase
LPNGGNSFLVRVKGKNGKGIYPASVNYTTDLHSMGNISRVVREFFLKVSSVWKIPQDVQ